MALDNNFVRINFGRSNREESIQNAFKHISAHKTTHKILSKTCYNNCNAKHSIIVAILAFFFNRWEKMNQMMYGNYSVSVK